MTTEQQRTNSKGNGNGNNKKPEELIHKYSGRGQAPLREAVIIAGIPYFIRKSFFEKRNEDVITVEPYIEEATKKLRPPFAEECPYIPYEFETVEEPNQYLQRAKRETIDTLYQKVKSLASIFNDVDEHTINLLSANILGSYFQDRCSTIHYLFVVGDNGTGKSAFGDTFECLGYRAVNITNATDSFWFRVFGTNEAGQVTIIAEEFDRIDEKSQVMGMLKEGYHPNAKVPRMNNENTKMDFFLPFGFKIMIAEKSPSEDKAKGLIDRSFTIKTYKGIPKYDIKEVRNPQGNRDRQRLLDQIMDLRKLLLVYKLSHFKDPLPEVDVGLDGRDKELCKPLLQLFFGLGTSKETLNEIEKILKHFLDIKNNRKADSQEALVYRIIANIISAIGEEVSTATVWDSITGSIEGYFDKYVDKEGKEYVKNPNVFYTSDYGTLNRNSTIKMIRDKFGAEMRHKEGGNVLIFNPGHVSKTGKIYGKTDGIQTKLVESEEARMADAPDAPDALSRGSHQSNLLLNEDTRAQTEAQTSGKSANGDDNLSVKDGIPLRKSESGESGESAISALQNQNQSHNPPKVKCPTCDYVEHPFYMKLHKRHCPNAPKRNYKYNCEICRKNHRKRFGTDIKEQFEDHMFGHVGNSRRTGKKQIGVKPLKMTK
jgi:hypothetical protein